MGLFGRLGLFGRVFGGSVVPPWLPTDITNLGLSGDDVPHTICFSLDITGNLSVLCNGVIIEDETDISGGIWTASWDKILGGFHETNQCGEIIIYNQVLPDSNRILVENYLNTRYAIY